MSFIIIGLLLWGVVELWYAWTVHNIYKDFDKRWSRKP